MNRTELQEAAEAFNARYRRRPKLAAFAPGRVNLLGEHTDYNGGFVLPMALHLGVTILAAPRDDHLVRLHSLALDDSAEFKASGELDAGDVVWASYPRGVVAGFYRQGIATGGFDALIASDLPLGAGLSSSAAFEVATATLLEALSGRELPEREKALLCYRAENEFAGVPCGIMDQFISVMARGGHMLFIDCRSEETRHLPFADEDMALLVVDSGVAHELARGSLARRRSECEMAAREFGVASLREVGRATLEAAEPRLDPVLFRRARHVLSENERTLAAAVALGQGDWPGLGRLLAEGHISQRESFESTCSEIDWLVDFADKTLGRDHGVLGSRMTGGGFGGSTISLVERGRAGDIGSCIEEGYRRSLGRDCDWFVVTPAAGCRLLSL